MSRLDLVHLVQPHPSHFKLTPTRQRLFDSSDQPYKVPEDGEQNEGKRYKGIASNKSSVHSVGPGHFPGSGLTDETDPPLDDHDLSVFGWGFINIRVCVLLTALTVSGAIWPVGRSRTTPVAGA